MKRVNIKHVGEWESGGKGERGKGKRQRAT
jgi:hypothetical protein